jgi:hypothetical protein
MTELMKRALQETGYQGDMRLVHTNRHGLDLAKRLFETPLSSEVGEADEQSTIGNMSYERKLPTGAQTKVCHLALFSVLETAILVLGSHLSFL